jgi:hypothetical protein
MMPTEAARELPRYKSHKEVWALKIKKVVKGHWPPCQRKIGLTTCGYGPWERMHETSTDPVWPPAGRHSYDPGDSPIITPVIYPEDEDYFEFGVSSAYMAKHDPQPGGYWVRYEDGYESYSPAEAFEGGYTRI